MQQACRWADETRSFFRVLGKCELFVANSAFVVITAVICWNVFARYVLKMPSAWAEDIIAICFAWLIFIGAAAVHSRREHIGVDLLTFFLPKRFNVWLGRISDAFMLVFCGYAATLSAEQTYVSHFTTKTSILGIPQSVFFGGIALGFFLMALHSIQHLVDDFLMPDAE